MTRWNVLSLLLLAAAPAAALTAMPSAAAVPALRLRGGNGVTGSIPFAKVATHVSSVHAALLALAPAQAFEVTATSPPSRCWWRRPLPDVHVALQAYGVKSQVSGLSLFLVRKCGCSMMSAAILAAMTLCGSAVPKAVGWSLLPQVFSSIESDPYPPWRQPRGKTIVSLVNSHTNATSKR